MSRNVGYARAQQALGRLTVDESAFPPNDQEHVAPVSCYTPSMNLALDRSSSDPTSWIPREVGTVSNHQTDLPRIARDEKATAAIEAKLGQIPSTHELHNHDARSLDFIADESIHLIVTSPPYWTLKRYRDVQGQLGHVTDYDSFLNALDEVWRECKRALVPGGRVICVVGDVWWDPLESTCRHASLSIL